MSKAGERQRRGKRLIVKKKIESAISQLIDQFRQYQSVDGAWRYCLESGPAADAYAIVLLRTLEIEEEELIQKLAERLLVRQAENGAWKLYHDDQGNLNATVEAYYALLYSGCVEKDHPQLEKAKQFILQHGGIQNITGLLTQALLVLTDQMSWPKKENHSH
jgi:sporulenol synthase